MSYSYAFGSCLDKVNINYFGFNVVANSFARFVFQGDLVYITGRRNTWGVSPSVSIGAGAVSADMQPFFEQACNIPGVRALLDSGIPIAYLPDDHDGYTGDNWDHTITQANDGNPGTAFTTQTEVDASYNEGRITNQMVIDGAWGGTFANEVNADAGVGPQKPPSADAATPVSNYPVRYWKEWKDLANRAVTVSPHTVHIYLSVITHRSDFAVPSDPANTMLGSIQLQWLKDQLLAAKNAGASFVVIWSNKKTYNSAAGDNADTWAGYEVERDEILDYIDTIALTGVIWATGDKHRPQIISIKTADGGVRDHFCIMASPASVALNGQAANADGGIVWLGGGVTGGFSDTYGALHIGSTAIISELRDAITDQVLQRWRSTPDTNYATAVSTA